MQQEQRDETCSPHLGSVDCLHPSVKGHSSHQTPSPTVTVQVLVTSPSP